MKSKELRTFLANISSLNNSFTHYTFVWNQFSIDYESQIKQNPEKLTEDLFAKNPFAEKHNIKLSKLDEEHEKTHRTLLEGIYLLTFSYYESYLKEIVSFVKSIDETTKNLDEKLEDLEDDYLLIDKVINRTNVDKSKVNNLTLKTLDYLRLKRNRLIHRNSEEISHSLSEIIKEDGIKLNKYWKKELRAGLQEIDFSSKDKANEINFNFIIDSINILRFIIQNLDFEIMKVLKTDKIVTVILIPKFKKQFEKEIKRLSEKRLLKKFKSYSKSQYSVIIDDSHGRELIDGIA